MSTNEKKIAGVLQVKERGNKKKIIVKLKPDSGKAKPITYYKEPSALEHNGKRVIETIVGGEVVRLELEGGEILFDKTKEFAKKQAEKKEKARLERGQKRNGNSSRNKQQNQNTKEKLILDTSFKAGKSMLPEATRNLLAHFHSPDNFHLKFYKAARRGTTQDQEKFAVLDQGDKDKAGHQLDFDFSKVSLPFAALGKRQLHHAQAIGFSEEKQNLINLTAKNDWRWIVGMGNASVYENGITLHHILGIPYIPGSGVKGLVRTVIIKECFEGKEDTALQNALFRAIFGHGDLEQDKHGQKSSGQQGSATFFDAFPSQKPILEPDIINSHYGDYYQSEDNDITPPADWLEPIPVFFMSVKGGQLKLRIGLQNAATPIGEDGMLMEAAHFGLSAASTRLQFLQSWLKYALSEHGIGAKTVVGYGRMTVN